MPQTLALPLQEALSFSAAAIFGERFSDDVTEEVHEIVGESVNPNDPLLTLATELLIVFSKYRQSTDKAIYELATMLNSAIYPQSARHERLSALYDFLLSVDDVAGYEDFLTIFRQACLSLGVALDLPPTSEFVSLASSPESDVTLGSSPIFKPTPIRLFAPEHSDGSSAPSRGDLTPDNLSAHHRGSSLYGDTTHHVLFPDSADTEMRDAKPLCDAMPHPKIGGFENLVPKV